MDPEIITDMLTSPDVQAELKRIANDLARRATQRATEAVADAHQFELPEYGTDLTVGTDRARAHVWAINGPALHAERKVGVLQKVVKQEGGQWAGGSE